MQYLVFCWADLVVYPESHVFYIELKNASLDHVETKVHG